MNSNFAVLLIGVFVAVASCSRTDDACAGFQSGYRSTGVDPANYPRAPILPSDREIISRITRCYAAKPYAANTTVRFAQKIDGSRTSYLVFDVYVMTDVQLIYAVAPDGSVTAAYRHHQI